MPPDSSLARLRRGEPAAGTPVGQGDSPALTPNNHGNWASRARMASAAVSRGTLRGGATGGGIG
ncbi:MAG: hypothetical protein WAN65_13240, partial [Candidatus Sulfotelmatobacter sp.]